MERVLIIGGAGFIGGRLAQTLSDSYCIRVLDISENHRNLPFEWFQGNVLDEVVLEAALKDVDTVLHCACTTIPITSDKDPEFDVNTNLIGIIRLLKAMVRFNSMRLLFISSGGAVYGNTGNNKVSEDLKCNPVSSYGVVKLAMENYMLAFSHQYGIQPLIVRPSNVYGLGQHHLGKNGVIVTFIDRILKGEALEVWGNGDALKDYLHVNDLIDFIQTALHNYQTGIYNVAQGRSDSVNSIIQKIEKVSGKAIRVSRKPAVPGDVREIHFDNSLAKETFGWYPKIETEVGIEQTWNEIVKRNG